MVALEGGGGVLMSEVHLYRRSVSPLGTDGTAPRALKKVMDPPRADRVARVQGLGSTCRVQGQGLYTRLDSGSGAVRCCPDNLNASTLGGKVMRRLQ